MLWICSALQLFPRRHLQETNMTGSRKTILALALLWPAIAAGQSTVSAPVPLGGQPAADAAGFAACDGGCASCDSCQGDGCGDCRILRGLCDDPLIRGCVDCIKDYCDTCREATWRVDPDVLILHRSTPGTRTVFTDPASGADLFDASALKFGFVAGPQLSISILDCDGWGFESKSFFISDWSVTKDVPNSALPLGAANLAVDEYENLALANGHFEALARLYSGEWNFRMPMFGNFSFLAGLRYISMTDRYQGSGTNVTTLNTAAETITTHNHLYGFQLGADGIICQHPDRWKIMGFVKGGIYANDADQGTVVYDPGGLGAQAVSNNIDVATFVGEAGLTGYVQINKHLSATAGYQVMFISSVAQPVNQISGMNLSIPSSAVDTSAGLLYHGATAGFEVTW
jgi:hypothetical protein